MYVQLAATVGLLQLRRSVAAGKRECSAEALEAVHRAVAMTAKSLNVPSSSLDYTSHTQLQVDGAPYAALVALFRSFEGYRKLWAANSDAVCV